MAKTRVALFAGQDLGYLMADYFSKRKDIDLFVVCFHSQRDNINGYRSALTVCKEKQIPFVETDRPNDTGEALRQWQPDIIVCAYYARLFSAELLKIPRLGAINVHPGKFPRYQGPMPTPWYILNGEKTFGVGVFQIDEGVDTGPVFVQREYPILDDETGHELLRRTMTAAAELYMQCFDSIVRGEIAAVPQHGQPEFCDRIEPQFHIDWNASSEIIRRQVRVHAKPYFPAFTFLYNRIIMINRAAVIEAPSFQSVKPGAIAHLFDDGSFAVACGEGCLTIQEYETFPELTKEERDLYFKAGVVLK